MAEYIRGGTEIPRVLYRVTLPSRVKISDGYFCPHNLESKYGRSLPMIHRRDLTMITFIFGGREAVKVSKFDYFFILAFDSSKLENIIPLNLQKPSAYWEYFAEAPVNALINAVKFKWKEPTPDLSRAWEQNNFSLVAHYLGCANKDELVTIK